MEKLQSEVLRLLGEDARYTAAQIAAMTGAGEEEVAAEIVKLEEAGVIVKYSAIVNSEAVDMNVVQALIEVRVTPKKLRGFDAVAEELNSFPEVKNLYLMSGGFDIAVFVEAKSLADVSRFVSDKLSAIEGVLGTATHFILKRYKIEGKSTLPAKEEQRTPVQA